MAIYMGSITTVTFTVKVEGGEDSSIKGIKSNILKRFEIFNNLEAFESIMVNFASVDQREFFEYDVTLKFAKYLEYPEKKWETLIKQVTELYHVNDIHISKSERSIYDVIKDLNNISGKEQDDDEDYT